MKYVCKIVFSLSVLITISGCWDQVELKESGIVMGLAIDEAEEGRVQLTIQVYKPTPSLGNTSLNSGEQYFNVRQVNETLYEAVRDFSNLVGRKTQWSHQRIIILSANYAKKYDISKTMDFLYRDHDPRLHTPVVIAEGKASDYLESKAFIDSTISQQLMEEMRSSAKLSAKSFDMDLLGLYLQLRSATGHAAIPYMHFEHNVTGKLPVVEGTALLKKGRLVGRLSPMETESYSMLRGIYKGGIVKFSCVQPMQEKEMLKESVEVIKLNTTTDVQASLDEIRVKIVVKMMGTIGELDCSDVYKSENEQAFIEKIQKTVEGRMQRTMKKLQEHQVDAIGIGNRVYQQHPSLWKKLQDNWGERFAQVKMDIEVQVLITNTGMFKGKSAESR